MDDFKARAAWLKDGRELRRQLNATHSELKASLSTMRREQPDLVSDAIGIERDLTQERLKEKDALWRRLSQIKDGTTSFKAQVEKLGDGPSQVKRLKSLMGSTEAGIASFCTEQRRQYDAMRREEAMLTRDVEAMEEMAAGWPSHPLAGLDKQLAAPLAVAKRAVRPPRVASVRRPMGSSPGEPRRVPPSTAAVEGDVDTEIRKARSAAARQREEELRQAKAFALKEWRARKEAEARADAQSKRAAALEEDAKKVRHMARVRQRNQASLDQYRARKEAEAERRRAAEQLLTPRSPRPEAAKAVSARAAAAVEAAADSYARRQAAAKQAPRSEQVLLQAAEKRRHQRLGLSGDVARLASAHTKASAAKEQAGARRAAEVAGGTSAPAHDAVVPSSAGAVEGRVRSFTFGAGSGRAVPAWRQNR